MSECKEKYSYLENHFSAVTKYLYSITSYLCLCVGQVSQLVRCVSKLQDMSKSESHQVCSEEVRGGL